MGKQKKEVILKKNSVNMKNGRKINIFFLFHFFEKRKESSLKKENSGRGQERKKEIELNGKIKKC